jgi:hypothetical protein
VKQGGVVCGDKIEEEMPRSRSVSDLVGGRAWPVAVAAGGVRLLRITSWLSLTLV